MDHDLTKEQQRRVDRRLYSSAWDCAPRGPVRERPAPSRFIHTLHDTTAGMVLVTTDIRGDEVFTRVEPLADMPESMQRYWLRSRKPQRIRITRDGNVTRIHS